jgi:hypothetical protein
MRIIFGLVGLVVVLAIVSSLAKKQFSAVGHIQVPQTGAAVTPADASVKAQSQHIQQQIKQSVEAAMQQARPVGEEK